MSTIAAHWKSGTPHWAKFVVIAGGALLLAFAAIPNLMRSRIPAEEVRSLSQLRTALVLQQKAETGGTTSVSLPTRGLTGAQEESAAPGGAPSATTDRKIVRTGALELTVLDPAVSAEKIRLIAESMGKQEIHPEVIQVLDRIAALLPIQPEPSSQNPDSN